MKSPWEKIAALVFVVAVALGMSLPISRASASVAQGAFKLPFTANVGNMKLAAGDYTYSVDEMSRNGKIIIYQGTQAVGILLAQSFSVYDDKSPYPVLVFVRHEGNATLRAVKFPRTGTFYFALPKEMNTLIAQQPQLIETIEVQANGH